MTKDDGISKVKEAEQNLARAIEEVQSDCSSDEKMVNAVNAAMKNLSAALDNMYF